MGWMWGDERWGRGRDGENLRSEVELSRVGLH